MLTFIQTDQDDLDVLFVVDQDHCVRRVVRGEIEINEPRELEGVIDLPYEIVHQIVFYKFLTCLIMKQFEQAFRWISFSKTMIRRIYYGVYGHSDIGWFEKLQRLSRTFDMIAAIHHEFLMDRWGGHEMFSIPAMTFPAIVMEYNTDYFLQNTNIPTWENDTDYFLENTVFYPWEFSSYASIVDIGGLFDHGVIKNLGYHYIDRAALYNPHYRDGYVHCEEFLFPFVHIMPMDRLRVLNIFNHPETRYYFGRFSMLMKAIYGRYSKIFFIESTKQFDPDIPFEIQQYHFMDLPNVERRKMCAFYNK